MACFNTSRNGISGINNMSKKSKINIVLAQNIPGEEQVSTGSDSGEGAVVEATTPVEDVSEESETVDEEEEVSEEVPSETSSSEKPAEEIKYKPIEEPLGTVQENGIRLCIILLVLILLALGFLIYHERTWRQDENADTTVVLKYDTLRAIVKNYVSTISDPRKAEYCSDLRAAYIEAANSRENIDVIIEKLQTKSQVILGFNERRQRSNEHEWQKLIGAGGIIDAWLAEAGIILLPETKHDVFMAIAEGLR